MNIRTAFADEYGNNSFQFDTQGSHFVIATVICKSEKIDELEQQVDAIRKKHNFQTGEIKSSGIAKNYKRRLRVLEDVVRAIGVDDFGNIYIAGETENANGGRDYITIKYDQAGTELWTKHYGASGGTNIAKAEKLAITSTGEVIITGTIDKDGNKDFATIKYDTDGKTKFIKEFDAGNLEDKATAITIKNDEIYISGTSKVGTVKHSSTVKYSIKEKPVNIVYVGATPSHNANELLIRFDRSQINYSAIDKKDFEAGNLSDFVNATGLASLAQATEMNWDNFPTYKIFRRMTVSDTFSISRLGDTIKMPDFWATLSVIIPTGVDIDNIITSIENDSSKSIHYVHKNFIGMHNSLPNDVLIPLQNSLQSASYSNAHINLENAWNITVGSDNTKVGVFDDPIQWSHEDFGDGTYSGSKIAGGWDYPSNTHISSITTPAGIHGTATSGIIGALRNNNKGIAGIAGGNIDNDNNTGVQLFSYGIFDASGLTTVAKAASAIIEGSAFNPSTGYGYGLHLQNHSWGGGPANSLTRNAVKSCWRNQCTFIVSLGNDGNSTPNYPASYNDTWEISVGASGTDGEYYDGSNGDQGLSDSWASSYGGGVDLIAPGVTDIVTSLTSGSAYECVTPHNNAGYTCFSGTSAAAPHVTGVASLMYSQHNKSNGYRNNLSPDDIEHILQKNATDKGVITGYDDDNGWGLLNANATLEKVSGHYRVEHSPGYLSNTQTQISTNQWVTLSNFSNVASGTYQADKYKVTFNYSKDYGANAQIIDYWDLPSTVIGTNNSSPLISDYVSNVTYNLNANGHQIDVTQDVFCYFIRYNITGQLINKWVPNSPGNLRAEFSLHIYDTDYTGIDYLDNDLMFDIFPNPTNSVVNINYKLNQKQDLKITIYTDIGQIIYSNALNNASTGTDLIDVSNLSKGIYLVNLTSNSKTVTKKIIIN